MPFWPWVRRSRPWCAQGRARGWVTLEPRPWRRSPAPELSAELVEELLEALAELEIEVADEFEAPALRGRFPDRLARDIGRLVRWGQERGYVTRAKLLAAMPPAEVDEARFNSTVASLLGMGIRVVEGSGCAGQPIPRYRTRARLMRSMSSSGRAPMRTPRLARGTVVILSIMARQSDRKPLPREGLSDRRRSGASVTSVVQGTRVTEPRSVELVGADDDGGARLTGIDAAGHRPDLAARYGHSTEIASTKAWSSFSCSLSAMARDCRRASSSKPGARVSGTQICSGRSPWRRMLSR